MLNHYVFFKLKKDYTDFQKKEAVAEIIEALKILPDFIEEILAYEIVTNVREGGADIGLISKFDNLQTLKIYQNHPKHLAAVKVISKHKHSSTFMDFEKSETVFEK
ncbi:MAG: Dabb family protein [Bacteroidales bacterium]|nr:Dabb family protein [Bacteroidales bacterium]